ncbi:MAG: tRNA epoxyqueuosine(34) reductase QueG [Pirellulales bacterium]|nr:tRNA epoxyqueuosine(34) reductase QueG [Pirellulales bacterium]
MLSRFFSDRNPRPVEPATLTRKLKAKAQQLGFELAGACPAVAPPGMDRFRQWLASGHAGQMHYLAERTGAYEHPRHVLESVRSLLMLAVNYRTREASNTQTGQGRVSRYAWGADYHEVVRRRLHELADFHRELTPGARVRGVIDTAPLLEREFAHLAGLGWIGKNTLLLHRQLGSWFFLAAVLTTETLAYDPPQEAGHCGTCRACLDACPTGALIEPYQLDARRCISYLTIELGEAIPAELRRPMGDWLFGCDICQEVCPWNRRSPASLEEAFRPAEGMDPVELCALFYLDDESFRRRFRATPLWRPRRRGLLRNAAIVLGNRPAPSATAALIHGLNDVEPLVRGACAWALKRYDSQEAQAALADRAVIEDDADVRRDLLCPTPSGYLPP